VVINPDRIKDTQKKNSEPQTFGGSPHKAYKIPIYLSPKSSSPHKLLSNRSLGKIAATKNGAFKGKLGPKKRGAKGPQKRCNTMITNGRSWDPIMSMGEKKGVPT